jgi:hypothetical protein
MIKTLIFAFFWTSCSSQIQVTDHIDLSKPLNLTISILDKSTGLTAMKQSEILPGSEKYKKFVDWCRSNDKGWSTTFDSYNSKATVSQNNFRFLLLSNGVVVGFTDKKGDPKQFTKATNTDDLAFLTKE